MIRYHGSFDGTTHLTCPAPVRAGPTSRRQVRFTSLCHAFRDRGRVLAHSQLLQRGRLPVHPEMLAVPRRALDEKTAPPSRSKDAGCTGCNRPPKRSMRATPVQPFACSRESSPRKHSLTRIAGDESLSRRPMERIMTPLREMGAAIEAREDVILRSRSTAARFARSTTLSR